MSGPRRCRNPYESALIFGLGWAVFFGLLAGITLDMGEMGRVYEGTLITYAALFLLILIQRPKRPTPVDLIVLKHAFPALYFVGFVVYPYAWHLRGVR